MREWLTVIIILLISGILLDGIRRMRAHRRETLRLSRRMPEEDEGVDERLSSSEFPSGGPRVASYRDPDEVPNINQNLRQSYADSRKTRGAPRRAAESGSPENPVPMLMDSVEESANQDASLHSDIDRAGIRQGNSDADHDERRQHGADDFGSHPEPTLGSLDDLDDNERQSRQTEVDSSEYRGGRSEHRPQSREPAPSPDAHDEGRPAETEVANEGAAPKNTTTAVEPDAQSSEASDSASAAKPQQPDEVLVIHVMARRENLLSGSLLLDSMLQQGLRFGEMDIFHRHESPDGYGKILFSVANMVMPGTFDLDDMEQFETPGITMFLSLPIAGDSIAAYDLMARTALGLAADLDGELKDENRSVMTRQTIEHGRQRVVEYERKRRLANKG